MKCYFFLYTTISCIFIGQINSLESVNFSLELIQVIFRHGARTPSEAEAKLFKLEDVSTFKQKGFNQLTNEGKQQSYNLGVLLRKEYDKFLGYYHPQDVYARSSVIPRTKMSLQLVLAGLYPPSNSRKWNSNLNWQPIAFEQATNICDEISTPYECKKYFEIYRRVTNASENFMKVISKYNDLFDEISNITGTTIWDDLLYNTCAKIHYMMYIHILMNLPLPTWCSEEMYKSVRELLVIVLKSLSMTPELTRINGGTLIRQLLENIKSNSNSAISRKIHLYCTHEMTIIGISDAMKIKVFDIPPPSSAVIMEKFRDNEGAEFIRLRSWDGSSEDFSSLRIGDCDEYCPLDNYKNIVKDIIPTDEELESLTAQG